METVKSLQPFDLYIIVLGIIMGTLGRIVTLRVDVRQNPSYPNGNFINLVGGFIAAALGAVAIPALLARDFVAVTFLTLAVQNFREIRKTEEESYSSLEHTEYAKRGKSYTDGIAKTFEARNYNSLLASLATVLFMTLFDSLVTRSYIFSGIIGVTAGLATIYLIKQFTKGKTVGDVCIITQGKITVEGSELYVDGIFLTNLLGTDQSRELFLNEGVSIVIKPKKDIFRLTLENYGQRQAILFEATRALGVKRYKFIRRSFAEGVVAIAFVPIIRDMDTLMDVVKKTPILESSRKLRSIMDQGGSES